MPRLRPHLPSNSRRRNLPLVTGWRPSVPGSRPEWPGRQKASYQKGISSWLPSRSPRAFATRSPRSSPSPPRLAAVQNRLATGKKVNSAVDNPVNFFTAAVAERPLGPAQGSARRHLERHPDHPGRFEGHRRHHQAGRVAPVDRQAGPGRRGPEPPDQAGTALATAAEAAVTSKSLKDIALDKSIIDVTTGAPRPAPPTPPPRPARVTLVSRPTPRRRRPARDLDHLGFDDL